MKNNEKEIKTLDNFCGIKWHESIENALKLFTDNENVTLMDVAEIDGVIAFKFTGFTYFDEPTTGVGLGFIKNKFIKGFIVINETSKESAINTLDRLKSKLFKNYGEPDKIDENHYRWIFDQTDSSKGNAIDLMIVNDSAVCIQYACGSLELTENELEELIIQTGWTSDLSRVIES